MNGRLPVSAVCGLAQAPKGGGCLAELSAGLRLKGDGKPVWTKPVRYKLNPTYYSPFSFSQDVVIQRDDLARVFFVAEAFYH